MGIRINFPSAVYSTQVVNYTSILGNIAKILPLIIGIILLVTFLKKENKGKYNGFVGALYDFLTFKTFCFKKVLEVVYLFISLYYTVYGALYLFINLEVGLTYLVLYNVMLRLVFVFFMLIYKLKENSDKVAEVLYDDFEDDMIYEMEVLPEELEDLEDDTIILEGADEEIEIEDEVEITEVEEIKEEKKPRKRTKKSEEEK